MQKFRIFALFVFISVAVFLAGCASANRSADEVQLDGSALAADWWMHVKNGGCELTTLQSTSTGNQLNWHPSALQKIFPSCVARYTDSIDLLVFDCKTTRLKRAIVYSRKKTACRLHQDNR